MKRDGGPKRDGIECEWSNDKYWVTESRIKNGGPVFYNRPIVRLGIQRIDQRTCDDWRDFQAIKNDICGPESEALQLYPAESRLLDPSNYYLLWVLPKGRIDIGISAGRNVLQPEHSMVPQRAFA